MSTNSARTALLVGVMLACSAASTLAQVGTPPPYICGRTYAFSKGVPNGNVVMDEPGLVRVDTLHFVTLVGATFSGGCPGVTATVMMEATLPCDSGGTEGPHVFGPFSVATDGFTTIPIDVPVAAGPERVCDLVVVSTLTFSDGVVLRQQGDQQVCVQEPVPGRVDTPLLEVEIVGDSAATGHPGDTRTFRVRVRNNSSDHFFDGSASVAVRSRSDVPQVVAGTNDLRRGAYALGDPGGGDAPPMAIDDDCPPQPPAPHLNFITESSVSLTLAPGESIEFDISVGSYTLAVAGATGEAIITVGGFLGGKSTHATAGIATGADIAKPAEFACPGTGRAAIASMGSSPKGPTLSYLADATPGGTNPFSFLYILDPASVKIFANGSALSGTNFSTVGHAKDQLGRHVVELSFLSPRPPSNAIIDFDYELIVEPATAGLVVNDLTLDVVGGAPNGFAHLYPFARGYMDVILDNGLAFDPVRLHHVHQLQAVGVDEGTFSPRQMELLGLVITPLLESGRLRVESTWKAVEAGTPRYVGFDVFHDIRAYATPVPPPPCPADFNGDGVVNTLDFIAYLNAFNAGDISADMDGNGVLNTLDFVIYLNYFNTPC